MKIEQIVQLSLPMLVGTIIASSAVSLYMYHEYRFYREAATELHALQEEYRSYLSTLKKSLDAESKPDDELSVDQKKKTFVILDRNVNHLRASTEDYIRRHKAPVRLAELQKLYSTDHLLRDVRQAVVGTKRKRQLKRQPQRRKRRIVYRDIVLSWPIDRHKYWLSSFFGPRKRANGTMGYHYGLDMAALKGTPVKAAAGGVVIEARSAQGYGNTVVIRHNNTYSTRYAHLHRFNVRPGMVVKRGQCIGAVGDTGFVRKSGRDASHLHLEVYRHQRAINPMYVLA